MGALFNVSADMHVRLCADKMTYKYGVSELLERALLLTCSDSPEVIQSDAEANTEAPLLRYPDISRWSSLPLHVQQRLI